VASQRVEDTRSVRGLQVGEDEEAAWSGGDDIVLAEQREVLPADAARDGVDHQARVCLEDLVNDDPPPRAETEVEEIAFGVFRGGAPAGADGAEVHVAVRSAAARKVPAMRWMRSNGSKDQHAVAMSDRIG
jgi:hypothetical protein